MKHIVVFLLTVFIFVGCAPKKVVEIRVPQYKQTQNQTHIAIKSEDKEVIQEIEPNVIEEDVVPFLESSDQLKIAFVYSSKMVAKYVNSSASTVVGYLSFRDIDYNLKVIDTDDESIYNIQKTFDELKEQGIYNVIALFTPMAMTSLQNVKNSDIRVYLPLIEKNDALELPSNYIYGSISYEEQLKTLINHTNGNYAMFYQDSFLGRKLRTSLLSITPDLLFQKEIEKDKNNFKSLIKDYRINRSSVFMNTDVVKTSLILSQITANEVYPSVVLSTQLNYDPKLIELTQERDRNNFIVANSIDDVDDTLRDTIDTFGGNVTYEWVDYSTLVGINYLYDKNITNLIKTPIEDNKVIYTPRLYQATEAGFLEIK